jgi:arylsulfatase A-like enzyme
MEGSGALEGPAALHEQFFLAHTAEQTLRELAGSDRPFCLVASFWGPHHPYFPSEEFAAKIDPEDIPVYPSYSESLENKPLRYSAHRDLKGDSRANLKWPEWPGRVEAGKRVDALVNSMDVTGTLLSATGAFIDDIDGRDLVPLCQPDPATAWSNHLVCEHYGHSGDVLHQRIAYQNHWKYVAVYGDEDELYNLTDDP